MKILEGQQDYKAQPEKNTLRMEDGTILGYRYLFNCTGLQADRIAMEFGVGEKYTVLPFKGLYWQLRENCPFKPKTNLYPVPDLNVPFLGVHFTPSADKTSIVSIGPTATPSLGRENYQGLERIEPGMAVKNVGILAQQYIANRGGFRRYVHEQAFLALRPMMIRAAQELIPELRGEHVVTSNKVGIRSQLFNKETKKLEDDFLCVTAKNSIHVLNAISPAFTASFALADLIIDKAIPEMKLS